MILVILMKIVGTICEYNPFHNGHLYCLKKIREKSRCDILVVCLSTYFTMRGDLAIHNPKIRARYALEEADIVVGLPSVLAVNDASRFADFAVKELNKLKVSEVYCGSETGDITKISNLNLDEAKLKEGLNKHLSYKKATTLGLDLDPNDLLAYTYLKAIKKNNFKMELKLIKRIGDTHDTTIAKDQTFTSSTAIRNNLDLISTYSPGFVSKNTYDMEKLFPYFKFQMYNYNDFTKVSFIKDGIHKHILNNLSKAKSFKELVNLCTNSYYTKTKIKRAIFYLLFNIEDKNITYPYSKILGFNEKGKDYLNKIKKDISLITNNKAHISNVLDYEIKIAKILDLIYKDNILALELAKPYIKA